MADLTSPESERTCTHHWVIGKAVGEISPAVCKHCGASRDFPNTLPNRYIARREQAPDKAANTPAPGSSVPASSAGARPNPTLL